MAQVLTCVLLIVLTMLVLWGRTKVVPPEALLRGPRVKATEEIRTLMTAVEMYRMTFGQNPESLEALMNNPKGVRFLAQETIPLDPWNNSYVYTLQGPNERAIVSYGADGRSGGSGNEADINSANLKVDKR